MKKILSIAVVMAFGITVSFAQSATSNATTSNPKEEVQVASPVVKAVDVNATEAKCAPVAGKSCCNGANKASAITSGVGSEINGTQATSAEKSCKSVTVGMSAAKPETSSVPDPEK